MDLSSGFPFWLIKNGLPFDYPPLRNDIKTDIVILGGGISGALAAYILAKAGVKAIVVDSRSIGLGSTCASTAMLQYEIDTPLHKLQKLVGLENAVSAYKECDKSIDTLFQIAEEINFKDIEKTKSLYYAATSKHDNYLKKEYQIRKENGFNVSLLNSDEVNEYAGIKSSSAILSDQAAQTNAYMFAHKLLQASIKLGVNVYDRTNVVKIEHNKNSVKMQTENNVTINAKMLVYANGYEAVKYISQKIVQLNSTYAICSDQGDAHSAPFKNKFLLWNTANPYLYLRTTSDNRILIGGRDEKFYNPKKRDQLLKQKTVSLSKDFRLLYPDVNFKPEFSWCGTFGATKDGLPYIGNYKKLPNSFFNLGFGGNGITFSVIAAEILKDTILGKKNPLIDLFAFNR